jgi:S1-C subfamily serine protease
MAVAVSASLVAGCATSSRPAVPNAASVTPSRPVSACAGDATLGLEVAELSRAARARLDTPATLDGAVVTAVFDDGPAARAGVRVGDVVVAIRGQGVVSRATR